MRVAGILLDGPSQVILRLLEIAALSLDGPELHQGFPVRGRGLPGGDDCICPHVYDPVVCIVENPDGTRSKQLFSNACVAACAGHTHCFGFATP